MDEFVDKAYDLLDELDRALWAAVWRVLPSWNHKVPDSFTQKTADPEVMTAGEARELTDRIKAAPREHRKTMTALIDELEGHRRRGD